MTKKLNIILYNSFGDYRQTNIGRQNDQINEANRDIRNRPMHERPGQRPPKER
jgi:hypothetical protein